MLFIFLKKVIEMKFESYKCVDSNFAIDTPIKKKKMLWIQLFPQLFLQFVEVGGCESQFYFHYLQSTTSTNCGKSFVTELIS